jgi:hypothetical protein
MPLVADATKEQPATIAEERELRRQQIAENAKEIENKKIEDDRKALAELYQKEMSIREKRGEEVRAGREGEADAKIAAIRGSIREGSLDSALRPIQDENAERLYQKRIDEDRINRRKAKSIASKARQPETRARVAAREEKQYMSNPAVARRAKIAEERRDKREQEAESQIRSIREVTRRREDAAIREEEFEGRLKFIRRLNFDERLPKPGATYQPPKYERQQSVDNPEYQAAVEQAREKVNKIAGLSESQRASQLQRLIGKITIPKQIKPPETPAGPVSRFTKFKESTSSLFKLTLIRRGPLWTCVKACSSCTSVSTEVASIPMALAMATKLGMSKPEFSPVPK